ncbi:MAG: thioredoxin family protein [Phycisphaerae bacterium]|nr:thioredoxin family protein [Phycisphaerae bacterium]
MKHRCLMICALVVCCLLPRCTKDPAESPETRAAKTRAAKIEALKAAAPQEGSAFYDLSFEDACLKAGAESKVVMVDFFTTWCKPCQQLDQVTWKDEAVIKWLLGKTVALNVDAQKNTRLKQRYHIISYPTLVFIKPDGAEVGRVFGFQPPREFLAHAGRMVIRAAETAPDRGK